MTTKTDTAGGIKRPVQFEVNDEEYPGGFGMIHDANDKLVCETHECVAPEIVAALNRNDNPTPMLLWCPRCFEQHIDKPEPDVCKDCGHDIGHHGANGDGADGISPCLDCECEDFNAWLNDPHKKHRCNFCNHCWKPSEHPTTGVDLPELTHDARPQAFVHRKDFDDAVAIASGNRNDDPSLDYSAFVMAQSDAFDAYVDSGKYESADKVQTWTAGWEACKAYYIKTGKSPYAPPK